MNTDTLNNAVAEAIFQLEQVSVFYGDFEAVRQVSMDIPKNEITAFIGPSGCGKSTLLRCFNRLNDLIPGARVKGRITYHDQYLRQITKEFQRFV
ncbi:MAG: ATP-binding cassette domain-containing protein [Pleurocapsa sp. MO_226.B13]|nr:ATP-binding cassette domain-containing protein [Pleurocapsa sp. MO_226.B13]